LIYKSQIVFDSSDLPSINMYHRMCVLWAQTRSPLYRHLSHNVAREICLYIDDPTDLLDYTNERVYRVDPIKRTLQLWFKIDCSHYHVSLVAAVFMGKERVFMALQESTSNSDDCPYFAMFDQAIHRAPGNRLDTRDCALLYDSIRDCAYMFGGHYGVNGDFSDSRVCEKFLPSSCSVERLPHLLKPRSKFGVCWHKDFAYLCGGKPTSIEKFDPETVTFSLVGHLDGRVYLSLAFSYEGSIYLIDNSTIWKGDGEKWESRSRATREQQDRWDMSFSVVSTIGNFCYFLQGSECARLDMRTLTETFYPLQRTSRR